MPRYICKSCKSLTNGYYKTRGRATLNSLLSGRSACTQCDSTALLPVHTPAAKTMIEKQGYSMEDVAEASQGSGTLWKGLLLLFLVGMLVNSCKPDRQTPPPATPAPTALKASLAFEPAYAGEAEDVALAAIKATKSPCEVLYGAMRQEDGTIRAVCSGSAPVKYFIATKVKNGSRVPLVNDCDTNRQKGLPRCD